MATRAASRCSSEVARAVAHMVHRRTALTVTECCHRCHPLHTRAKGTFKPQASWLSPSSMRKFAACGLPLNATLP
jgi:hypothetical protein